jgi:hypothetical protein
MEWTLRLVGTEVDGQVANIDPEVRMLGPRVDVLPAVGLVKCGLDRPRFNLADCRAGCARSAHGRLPAQIEKIQDKSNLILIV